MTSTAGPPVDAADAERRIVGALSGVRSAVVAVSGGADSALVLTIAARVLGAERCLAWTSRSESLAPRELDDARAVARAAGVEHDVAAGDELDVEGFRRNAPDRCFHCKDSIYGAARALADRRGLEAVLDGTNADDVSEHRPGYAAGLRHGVRSPLLEAGLSKAWVRAVSRALGLATADKPTESCLASRFPYGTEITREGLERVRRAEDVVRAEGCTTVRVRVHGDVARIEVAPAELALVSAPAARLRVVEGIRRLGFAFVALDLEGFRSGSLSATLRPGPAGEFPVVPR